ncbi:MAG: 2OG-Fe(II) oxygenase, partial [Gammaproteobacteria bacterium]|nr:2OG-Fe(II) oxygenase [Gammaproteobacteria bacterium]
FNRKQIQHAASWLRPAAQAGHARAQTTLALFHYLGHGVTKDRERTAQLLKEAVKAGFSDALFYYANLLFLGIGVQKDVDAAQEFLLRAARAASPQALRVLGLLYSLSAAKSKMLERSNVCLLKAATLGDAFAQHFIGMRLLRGEGVAKDENAAQFWMREAQSRAFYPSILAARKKLFVRPRDAVAQPPPDVDLPIDEWQASVDVFDWPDTGSVALQPVENTPELKQGSGFLDVEQCEYIIGASQSYLQRSQVVDPVTGKTVLDKVRTSKGMNFDHTFKDIVIGIIEARMAAAAGCDISQGEPLAILKYGVNEEYKVHADYFSLGEQESERIFANGGQRIFTVLVYLNDGFVGGGTEFPKLATTVQPEQGKLLLIQNCDLDGTPRSETVHAGLPIKDGEKWLASLWIRQNAYREQYA